MTINDVLNGEQKVWDRRSGATDHALKALKNGIRVELPLDYLVFLSFCNGGDGWTAGQQDYFILYSAEETLDLNTNPKYGFERFYNGYFVFGSDGSSGNLAFKTVAPNCWRVHLFDSYEPELVNQVVGDNFIDFISKIVEPWPPQTR